MKKLILLILIITSCQKDAIIQDIVVSINDDVEVYCTIELQTNSDWSRKLNTITMLHTDGLEHMAFSGGHGGLQDEYCDIDQNAGIPKGLGDFENAGYAGIREYSGWAIAMFHPTTKYPDNWIMYHAKTRVWERYDLGQRGINNSGKITLLSSGIAELPQN